MRVRINVAVLVDDLAKTQTASAPIQLNFDVDSESYGSAEDLAKVIREHTKRALELRFASPETLTHSPQ